MPNHTIGRPFLTKKFAKLQKNREKNEKKVVETRNKRIQTNKILMKIPQKSTKTRLNSHKNCKNFGPSVSKPIKSGKYA